MPPRRPARRRPAPDSRARIFAAAAAEFAARGYAGANMDRVARAARLNKAMIYYHFGSKAALYREILRDMFDEVGRRVREVAASGAPPDDKVRGFVAAIATAAAARPHFPPIWLREVAEGAQHVDTATLSYARGVLQSLATIIGEGCAAGRFTPADPLIVHAGIVAPLMFFFVTDRVRRKFERAGVAGAAQMSREAVVAHVQRLALAVLEGRVA
jgi:TetR/AcrR family transcriptional regulator